MFLLDLLILHYALDVKTRWGSIKITLCLQGPARDTTFPARLTSSPSLLLSHHYAYVAPHDNMVYNYTTWQVPSHSIPGP